MLSCQRALFEQVILETEDGDTPAVRLYERVGFKLVTRFAHYKRVNQTHG
jgi:ribosomal protein S18 acetylase RimI-like enzyme